MSKKVCIEIKQLLNKVIKINPRNLNISCVNKVVETTA